MNGRKKSERCKDDGIINSVMKNTTTRTEDKWDKKETKEGHDCSHTSLSTVYTHLYCYHLQPSAFTRCEPFQFQLCLFIGGADGIAQIPREVGNLPKRGRRMRRIGKVKWDQLSISFSRIWSDYIKKNRNGTIDLQTNHFLVVGIIRLFNQREFIPSQPLLDLYQMRKLKRHKHKYIFYIIIYIYNYVV